MKNGLPTLLVERRRTYHLGSSSLLQKYTPMMKESNSIQSTMVDSTKPAVSTIPTSENNKLNLITKEHIEHHENNLVYDNVEYEPELHIRTYIAIAATCVSAFT